MGVGRRVPRPPFPRIRFEDGQGALGHEARGGRQRQPDLLPSEEREAVRGDRRDQSGRGLRPAVNPTQRRGPVYSSIGGVPYVWKLSIVFRRQAWPFLRSASVQVTGGHSRACPAGG